MEIVGALPKRGSAPVWTSQRISRFATAPRWPGSSARFASGGVRVDYFGTLKIAIRLEPILMVSNSVPTNTRFSPRTKTSRQPVPLVILSPLLAFLPCIVISLVAT
jgi:hypothetical protein